MINISNILNLRHKAEQSVATLPALMMQVEKVSASIIHGGHGIRKSGAGEQFWQFRDYHDKDHPQNIDWRQSAKGDTVFIKQKELQTTQRTYIWRASGKSMDYKSNPALYTKNECANVIALALTLILRRSEEQIGIFGDIKTGRSERNLQKIAQILLDTSGLEESLPNSLDFTIPNQASFIGISDFLLPIEDIKHCFSNINTKNALIIQTLDPAEIELSYSGRTKFYGVDSNNQELINNVASVRSDYKNRITAHINDLKSLCHTKGWNHVLYITDTNITATLQNIINEVGTK